MLLGDSPGEPARRFCAATLRDPAPATRQPCAAPTPRADPATPRRPATPPRPTRPHPRATPR